ncbi:MAG: 50S ribosomal protein L6, partial [Candidatus Cloacimonadales bacterium]|nr:50S ribosomal protein L6 [Candidatus Cloacimonadota bacterium]
MSRIGKAPIKLSSDVNIKIDDNTITVKGKLGELSYTLMPGISLELNENALNVKRADDTKNQRAVHG